MTMRLTVKTPWGGVSVTLEGYGSPMPRKSDNLEDLSVRQLVLKVLKSTTRLESRMADLSQAVAQLRSAVAGVAERILPQVQELQAQLAAAKAASTGLQEALDRAASEDVAEDAEFQAQIADLQAQLEASQAAADAAAGEINSATDDLNRIAAPEPGGPGDTSGQDNGEPPAPNPDDEPHPDQTLPGDLPQ
jgi:seryl-tRNA synthetase